MFMFQCAQYMAGGSLQAAIQARQPLLGWAARGGRIALDLAEGLLYLHTRRPCIVHRDLRSVNVLLTGDLRAKIADLGSAKFQERTALSSLSVVFNQSAAFPPESMIAARQDHGARSFKWDVWQAREAAERASAQPLERLVRCLIGHGSSHCTSLCVVDERVQIK